MGARTTFWFISGLVILGVYILLPKLPNNLTIPKTNIHINNYLGRFPLKLGLDLQGGTQLILETDMSKISFTEKDKALESAREVIERRVNQYGVSESLVQSSKLGDQRRLIVELPGITDASAAADLVGKTALLEFREIPASPSAEATQSGLPLAFFAQPTNITGSDLKNAQVTYNKSRGLQTGPQVSIQFTDEGAKKFSELTKRNLGKELPIFLDGVPITSPVVENQILDGNAIITGNYTPESAKQLAIQLNAGALPVPIHVIDQRSVGATLGQQSVERSLIAGLIGLIAVMIYMILFYGWYGLVANIALIIYTLFSLAIFKTGLFLFPPVTLTLAGIAGFILSIGMAVDANILIFERMKEERRWGKSNRNALEVGFKRAWSSIKDSNISSLITAAILYFMGTGPVKGFAWTLAIGVLVSMFTAIIVTRTFLRLVIKK